MTHNKKWIFKDNNEEAVNQLCQQYNIPRLTAVVLQNRLAILGNDLKNIKKDLIETLHDTSTLKDLQNAVDRINDAVKSNEHITIYGDYDADGVTCTVILFMYLKEKGANVDFYIPDRVDEGYGINICALDKIKANGAKLIITVDTGVTAHDEVEYAQKLGMDVIVTDHHECKSTVPVCHAVVDPKQEDCSYPFSELAGVGVVFKLLMALDDGKNTRELINKYMSFVCLGTIADVAPLIGENRAFVTLGLQRFSKSGNAGIDALLDVTNLKDKKVTAGNIGFIIAPRINAAGRLGSANKSVELFLCNDKAKAEEIAYELSQENKCRQNLELQILEEAVEIIESRRLHDKKVIVVAKSGWHHGVIGIVSSKITEKYYRPSILISTDENEGKGSGRSITGFNLFEALTYASDSLIQFGGHSLAAGLSINPKNINEFSSKINEYADKMLCPDDFIPPLHIDATINKEDITIENAEQLKLLEPYGMGNPTPIFAYNKARISLITTMSEGKHIKIRVTKDGHQLEAIGFNLGNLSKELKIGDVIDLAGTLDINCFRDVVKVQMIIKDIKKQNHR